MVAARYRQLYQLCRETVPSYGKDEFEDIFHECILFVYSDPGCARLVWQEEICRMFCYRFRMIEFKHQRRKNERKEIEYADYIQTKKNNHEEDEE